MGGFFGVNETTHDPYLSIGKCTVSDPIHERSVIEVLVKCSSRDIEVKYLVKNRIFSTGDHL